MSHSTPGRYQAGFTLTELIAILVIMGILAAVALPRFFDRQTFDMVSFSDQAQAMLRHGQKLAIGQHRHVHVRIDSARIAFCFNPFGADGSCTNPIPAPTGSNSGSTATLAACGNNSAWFCEAIPDGVTYSAAPAMSAFFFNALGRPFNAADLPPDSTFAPLAITLTGGGVSRQIFVESETGYVHP